MRLRRNGNALCDGMQKDGIMIHMFTILAVVGAAWLGANALHGAWVAARRWRWDRRYVRDADRLLPKAAAYQVGAGRIALLFIHGFADTPYLWRRIADRLAAGGTFTCRAMRLPGSAGTAAQAKRTSLAQWRSQIDAELTRLRETHEAVWIVGHSMGGALALDAALRLPAQVDGVALFAPLVEVSRKRCPFFPAHVWFDFARVALCLSPVFELPFSLNVVAGDDPTFTYPRDRFFPFAMYCALFQLVRSNRKQAARLACPLFAVTAGRDSVVDSVAARHWLAACSAVPRKDIRDLPEAKHVIPLAPGWKTLFDDFAAFVLGT